LLCERLDGCEAEEIDLDPFQFDSSDAGHRSFVVRLVHGVVQVQSETSLCVVAFLDISRREEDMQ
jgi:hypothetical protein